MSKIQAVVMDWAGTAVDYGCFAPLEVFMRVFRDSGVEITPEEARIPMGLPKRDHIKTLAEMDGISERWCEIHGRRADDEDVNRMYSEFSGNLMNILAEFSDPVPGVVGTAERLRGRGLKIGSTTGYTAEMMEIVSREAAVKGYATDILVTPDEVTMGRPYPWMCYVNAMKLDVYPMKEMIKVGDTVADIREGINAGMWSVGVIKGSSVLGLSLDEAERMNPVELKPHIRSAYDTFTAAGAHYVILGIEELEEVIDEIDLRLENDEVPASDYDNEWVWG